jgi:hypothetical protein
MCNTFVVLIIPQNNSILKMLKTDITNLSRKFKGRFTADN